MTVDELLRDRQFGNLGEYLLSQLPKPVDSILLRLVCVKCRGVAGRSVAPAEPGVWTEAKTQTTLDSPRRRLRLGP